MKTLSSLAELRAARRTLEAPVGLVPTMGYLHEGHLSLIRTARSECRSVVVSIFVNPAQFGPGEDLDRYPRDLPRDLALMGPLGVDLVWTPTAAEMYPKGYQTWVDVEVLTDRLEGTVRPGHFRGVTTVVSKLLNGVLPEKAYFGQKDAQQAAVVRRMVLDLNFPLEIVVCPTVREPDGLALSSRNKYLEGPDRAAALVLYRGLTAARAAYDGGERSAERLREIVRQIVAAERRAQLQYVSCADYETLDELEHITGKTLLSLAVLIGKTRLIDNFVLD